MTAKEKLSFDQLVLEFQQLKRDSYRLNVNYNLMAENMESLLELKRDFSVSGGFVERLAQVVIDAIKEDIGTFKDKIIIEIKTLPCQSLEDKQAFCRIAEVMEKIKPEEKELTGESKKNETDKSILEAET